MKHTQKICNSRYLDNVGLPLHEHTYKHGMGRTESSTRSQTVRGNAARGQGHERPRIVDARQRGDVQKRPVEVPDGGLEEEAV